MLQPHGELKVSLTEEQLNGSQRVLLDQVISAEECRQLQRLSNVSPSPPSSQLPAPPAASMMQLLLFSGSSPERRRLQREALPSLSWRDVPGCDCPQGLEGLRLLIQVSSYSFRILTVICTFCSWARRERSR